MILSAIRIILYVSLATLFLAKPLTLVNGLLGIGLLTIAVTIGIVEYKRQVSKDK